MYPTSLKYTKDHEWISSSDGVGRVGITDYAQKQLGDVVYVELPDAGTKVSRGESFGTIESVKAVSELFAPVSGEVVEVNPVLRDKPELVNTAPHETWSNTGTTASASLVIVPLTKTAPAIGRDRSRLRAPGCGKSTEPVIRARSR